MKYREQNADSQKYKQNYLDGIERIIAQRQAEAEDARANYARDILSDGERYRADFRKMLGWPLVGFDGEDILVAAQTDNAYARPLSTYDYDYARYIKILGVRLESPDTTDACFERVMAG
jgi:hypothetical protein